MTDTVCYYSVDAKPHMAYLAFALLPDGSQWRISAFGSTEQAARDSAASFYEAQVDQAKRLGFNPGAELAPGSDAVTVKQPGSGRGSHLAGKVWAFHPDSKDKRLVTAEDFAKLEPLGYVKGGPRSK